MQQQYRDVAQMEESQIRAELAQIRGLRSMTFGQARRAQELEQALSTIMKVRVRW